MKQISEDYKNKEWSKFHSRFALLGLNKHFDMEELRKELFEAPNGTNEEYGTAYKGALLIHINMVCQIAEMEVASYPNTFSINVDSLKKVISLMHLSKRHMFVETKEDWKRNKGIYFEFAQLEGNLKCGERSAWEAMNRGVLLTPTEFEAFKCLDKDEGQVLSPLSLFIKHANEKAYAVSRERYNKK